MVQELTTEGLDADASRYPRALEADDFVGRGDMSRGGIGPGQRPRGPLLPSLDALRSGRPPTRQDNEPAH